MTLSRPSGRLRLYITPKIMGIASPLQLGRVTRRGKTERLGSESAFAGWRTGRLAGDRGRAKATPGHTHAARMQD